MAGLELPDRSNRTLINFLTDRYLWLISVIILAGALLASSGLFSIDEAIYYLGARAVAEGGTLVINNGFEQFQSESLKLSFLVDGPHGLTPQYPAGSAILAGVLLPLLGGRAFILLNALAAVLTLFTVRKICVEQFKSEVIAKVAIGLLVLGSFWGEYAIGIWPHALAVFFSTQAYWFALRHINSGGSDYRTALLSGLFAGSGFLFRLDSIFIVLAIGLIVVLFSRRFLRSSILVGMGLLPPMVLAGFLNHLKFGSPNPFSYGQTGGNTDLMSYGPVLAALCVALGALLVMRKMQTKLDRKRLAVSIIAIGGIALLVPPLASLMLKSWNGFVELIVDAKTIVDRLDGVPHVDSGTTIFFGKVKKALGQSLPWIGLTAILLTGKIREDDRRMIVTLIIGIATLMMPFVLLSWHGGGSSNMRYFLPAVPLLAILCAKLFTDLWGSIENPTPLAATGAWIALGAGAAWSFLAPSGLAGVHQILSSYVLIATALAAFAAGIAWRHQEAVRKVAIGMFSCSFLFSVAFSIGDFSTAQHVRETNHDIAAAFARLPSRSLVIAYPEWVVDRVDGNDSILAARRNERTGLIDTRLVTEALDAGYRVFLTRVEFDPSRDIPPGVQALQSSYSHPEGGQMIELRRRELLSDTPQPAPSATSEL